VGHEPTVWRFCVLLRPAGQGDLRPQPGSPSCTRRTRAAARAPCVRAARAPVASSAGRAGIGAQWRPPPAGPALRAGARDSAPPPTVPSRSAQDMEDDQQGWGCTVRKARDSVGFPGYRDTPHDCSVSSGLSARSRARVVLAEVNSIVHPSTNQTRSSRSCLASGCMSPIAPPLPGEPTAGHRGRIRNRSGRQRRRVRARSNPAPVPPPPLHPTGGSSGPFGRLTTPTRAPRPTPVPFPSRWRPAAPAAHPVDGGPCAFRR
jgi:hypothetical protein